MGLAADVQDLLADYAMTTRYPGDMEPLTQSNASDAVTAAKTALSSAQRIIRGTAPGTGSLTDTAETPEPRKA